MTISNNTNQINEVELNFSFHKNKKRAPSSLMNRQACILKSLRKQKTYTLYDLSKLSGLSPSYISRIEAGARRLNTETISKLALALGCKEETFFKDESIDGILSKVEDDHSFQKNLPVYRVIAEGLDVSDNPYSVIVLTAAMEYVFRPPKLSFSENGFAVYAVNNFNYPRYSIGDVLFFDSVKSYKVEDTLMIINKKGYMFIGGLLSVSDEKIQIEHYSNKRLFDFEISSVDKIFKLVSIEFQ